MNRSKSTPPLVMPILSVGRHRSPRQGACFMEFASYLAGEKWSDRPTCTHPLLAALARDVNDLTSDASRAELTPLIPRVIGLTSDLIEVTAMIAMRAACAALPIASLERQRALAVGILNLLASVETPEFVACARDAFAQAPDTERWARRYLAAARSTREFNGHAASAMVHTSAVGIALACVEDPDARLAALLNDTVDRFEAMLQPADAATRQLQPA